MLFTAVAAWYDLRGDRIPNRLILYGMAFGGILRTADSIFQKAPEHIFILLIEVIILFICLWPVYQTGGLGAGDVKLLLTIGIFLPVRQALFIIILSFLITAAAGGVWILADAVRKQKKKRRRIHFTLPVLSAAVLQLALVAAGII